MEKRVVLAMVLSALVLFAYTWFMPKPPSRPPGQQPPATAPGDDGVRPPAPGPGEPGNGSDAPVPGPAPVPGGLEPAVYEPVDDLEITGDRLDVVMTSAGGAVREIRTWGNPDPDLDAAGVRAVGHPADPGFGTAALDGTAGLLAVSVRRPEWPALESVAWHIHRGESGELVAEMEAGGLSIRREVSLPDPQAGRFHALAQIRFTAGLDGTQPLPVEIVGPWEPLIHPDDLSHYQSAILAQRGGDGGLEEETAPSLHKELEEDPAFEFASQGGTWKWIGVRHDFFLGALEPTSPLPEGTSVGVRSRTVRDPERGMLYSAAPTFRFLMPPLGPGESVAYDFRFYAGPNSHAEFERVYPGAAAGGAAPYVAYQSAYPTRWLSFGIIERALEALLKFFAGLGMGYGWAIVLLTVVVRGAMFPLSKKSQIAMRVHAKKMALIKPKMDAIKEKYKDPRKAQQKTMEMMRKENVSLLPSGCLLPFLQMPIWISLYGLLGTTFEMRYEGFMWFDDLTRADHLLPLAFAENWPVLHGWLNLLPIIMMITWGISAHMQPLPADPAQQQQAKMMRWMPMLFGVMLYGFSSGLCLYMTASALWSIGEVHLIRKVWLSKLDAA